MMAVLITVLCFLLPVLGANLLLTYLVYARLSQLILMNNLYKADTVSKAVQQVKAKKPVMPVAKQEQRGRNITTTDELVDIADMPWEDAYNALEDIGK